MGTMITIERDGGEPVTLECDGYLLAAHDTEKVYTVAECDTEKMPWLACAMGGRAYDEIFREDQ